MTEAVLPKIRKQLHTGENLPTDRVYIPEKAHIHSTSDVDGVNTIFGYWGPLSYPMRERLSMAIRPLDRKSGFERILDAGYGCGIMLPDLYRRLGPDGHLYGVDVHGQDQGTYDQLVAGEGMETERVHLTKSSLEALPFEDDFFDLIVSISVLEHIGPDKLSACMEELRRVARQDAQIVLGFPTDGLFIRTLSWLQKTDLKANHPSTHEDIFAAIRQNGFDIVDQANFPPLVRGELVMHYNVRLIKR